MRVIVHYVTQVGRRAAVAAALLLSAQWPAAVAQESPPASSQPAEDEAVVPEISRDDWRMRIDEARRRAREVASERRANPAWFEPPREDPAEVATERVLNDQSLQSGDIVSTRNGLFVFRGRSDRERRPDDFVPFRNSP